MHIILIGGGGYIGSEFSRRLKELRIDFSTFTHTSIFNEDVIFELYSKYGKEVVIINSAGYTGKPNVDSCEVNKEQTIIGNVVLVQKLVELCNRLEWTLAHISSGCIYQGSKADGAGFSEDDVPNFTFKQNNCSFYSGTKAIAEDIIKNELPSHYIWRLRIPFENIDNGRNYLSKLLKYETLLNADNSLSNKRMFVDECIKSLQRSVPFGIYNVVNSGHANTKLITSLLSKYVAKDKSFKFFENDQEFYKIAKTPRSNCILDNSKALNAGFVLPNVYDSIEKELINWNTK